MIHVDAIDHVVLRTGRVQAMIRFYTEVLGCPLEKTSSPQMGLFQLRAGTSMIDIVDVDGILGRKGGAPPGKQAHNMDHFCLRVKPFDESRIRSHLQRFGIACSELEIHYGAEGYGPALYLQDPDGNTVELKGPGE